MQRNECELYGELVVWLRNRAARLLAGRVGAPSEEELRSRLDMEIREWFFAPQADLDGLCPRDVIRGERAAARLLERYDPFRLPR